MMNWTTVCILLGILLAFYWLRRRGQISAKDARDQLKNGALLIDVRTPAEFSAAHIPGAKNLPLDQIAARLPSIVKDKNQPVLLHCQSGSRSGIAARQLRSLGYANVFNLGSYSRAASLAREK